jgi:hypothetical protein
MKKETITMRNKRGETESETLARGKLKHPNKDVVFEDPDTPPLAAQESSHTTMYGEYARGTHSPKKFKAEHPNARGEALLNSIWKRIRPDLVKRGIVTVPEELPSDLKKWAVLPDWVDLMIKHPFKGRNVFKWLDTWVPKGGHSFRNGAMKLTRRPDRKTARVKQEGQGLNDPRPAFTFHGDRIDFMALKDALVKDQRRLVSEGLYPDADVQKLDLESMDKWRSVMGGRCGSYVFAESSILFTGMTPHQETGAPIPWDIFWESWRDTLSHEFPSAVDSSPLRIKHAFVGVGQGPGIRVQNKDGAAGYPYSNMDTGQIQRALRRPKFKGRPTKGKVFQHALFHAVRWIEEGMPMSGPIFDTVAQPATLAFRGDRAVDLDIRALGVRGPNSQFHESADTVASLNPGRSVIIVPTVQVLMQSLWAQPLGDHIAAEASPGFDWVDPWHSSDRLDQLRRLDLDQAGGSPRASVGVDASGWDRDVTPQMHAGEAAWYCSMFPREANLLYVDSVLPIQVTDTWVASYLDSLQVGEEASDTVTAIVDDGSEKLVDVNIRKISFDFHEFICKVTTLVNDAPIAWGDYQVDAPGVEYSLAGAGPEFKGLSIVSNGGRRSGDGATGIGNSWSNLVVTRSWCKMSQMSQFTRLLSRRAQLQGEIAPNNVRYVDSLSRGDDLVLVIELDKGGTPSAHAAGGLCGIGLRANAKKQEASDIPGKPVFGFANVLVTENYMGKLLGRSTLRYMVQESMGLDKDTLDLVLEERGDLTVEAGLMTSTATAKSRLAPLAGFPLLDKHPGAELPVRIAVHHDKYRLSYISENSFDANGRITEEGERLLARAKDVEARVQARLRARRENVSVDLESLKEVYIGSTIHDLIEQEALVEDYKPNQFLLIHKPNSEVFKDLVGSA